MVSGALISVPRAECLTATVSVAVFPSSYIYIIGRLDWGCRSVAEYLPSLCEAPGLNPSTMTRKTKLPPIFCFLFSLCILSIQSLAVAQLPHSVCADTLEMELSTIC